MRADVARRTWQPAELQGAGEKEADKAKDTDTDKDKDKAKAGGAQTAWKVFQTPEGRAYYHNSATNQTTWQRPPELVRRDATRRGGPHDGGPHDGGPGMDRRHGGAGTRVPRADEVEWGGSH